MQQHRVTRAYAVRIDERTDGHSTRITNMQVRFRNTADVMVVVMVFANFQIQIVLDLYGYMGYGKQINVDLDV